MSYIDCFVAAVPTARRADYLAFSKTARKVYREHGALALKEYWGDDVPPGQFTSFPLAVKAEPSETVTISLIVWPSKAVRDDANPKIMADPRMQALDLPFDGKRAILGGFDALLEH